MMTNTCATLTLTLTAVLTLGVDAADWPQWRGPNRSDISAETGLLKEWPEKGPERLWLFEDAGVGYAGFSVVDGKLFTMGTRDGKDILLALDAVTGKELWAMPMGEVLENNWGDGPRGTPTVDGDRVYALGGDGTLVCVSAADGAEHWRVTMQELGGKTPTWGYTESVLVDGDQVICTPGGEQGAMAALNKKTGDVLWRSKDFTDGAQYASPVVFEYNGERQYTQLTKKSLVGVSAGDGSVLWRVEFPGKVAVIPTPVYRDGYVYVSSGYKVGCMLVKLGSNHQVETVYTNKVMQNHHGGVILIEDHLYGHSGGNGWVCQDFLTGEEVWSTKKFGKGAVAYADGMLYCVQENDGQVALAKASPQGWEEVSRFTLEPQTEIRKPQGRIWTHPVIANGRLYLRDQDLIFCFNVRE